jgi:hypothetical protein
LAYPGHVSEVDSDDPSAWRLTYEYDADGVRLVEQEQVAMVAPPDDSDLTLNARSGYWVEVRDARGHGLYRQVIYDPIRTEYEVHSPDVSSRNVKAKTVAGIFEVVVPALPNAHDVVLHGRSSREDFVHGAAVPLVTEELRATPPVGEG